MPCDAADRTGAQKGWNEGQAIQTERLMMQRSGGGDRESFARDPVEDNPFLHDKKALQGWRRQRIILDRVR